MLYEEVGPAFAGIDRITSLARDISTYNTGLLKVVAPPSLSAGVRPNVKIETHTVASACSFASRGLGVGIVNEMMARNFVGPEMVLRVFRPQILHPYVFVTSSLAPMNRLARALLEVALEYFAEQASAPGSQANRGTGPRPPPFHVDQLGKT